MSKNTSNRLGDKNDKFVRPKKTVQDKLTPNQIKDLLKDYVEVANVNTIKYTCKIFFKTKRW